MSHANLAHLDQLEADSVHAMCEVVAEVDNPVMRHAVQQRPGRASPRDV